MYWLVWTNMLALLFKDKDWWLWNRVINRNQSLHHHTPRTRSWTQASSVPPRQRRPSPCCLPYLEWTQHTEGSHSSPLFSTPETTSLVLDFVFPTLNMEQMVITKVQSWTMQHTRTRLREMPAQSKRISDQPGGKRKQTLLLQVQSKRMRLWDPKVPSFCEEYSH